MRICANDIDMNLIANVCRKFEIPGNVVSVDILQSGKINITYRVICENFKGGSVERTSYIVQRVNDFVFKDPLGVMKNIDLVTEHIMKKQKLSGDNDRRHRLHFHHTALGQNYYFDGGFWRLTNYIDRAVTYDSMPNFYLTRNSAAVYMIGKGFGHFQAMLSDFNPDKLTVTIPDFHNTVKRIDTLLEDAGLNPCMRYAHVEKEVEFIKSRRDYCSMLSDMFSSHDLPIRVTHNDTNANNVLLDEDTLEPLAVIDLDTVMPGLTAWDFGDAVRCVANTAPENEKDLSKVKLNLELYRAFARGYLEMTKDFLTDREIEMLPHGAVIITLELAARFLDDYIMGDKYFKTSYHDENADRARCQLALAKDMLKKFDEMSV